MQYFSQNIHHQTNVWTDSSGTISGTCVHIIPMSDTNSAHFVHLILVLRCVLHCYSVLCTWCSNSIHAMYVYVWSEFYVQTFVMEMMPQEAKTYRHVTRCTLNASTDYTQVHLTYDMYMSAAFLWKQLSQVLCCVVLCCFVFLSLFLCFWAFEYLCRGSQRYCCSGVYYKVNSHLVNSFQGATCKSWLIGPVGTYIVSHFVSSLIMKFAT